jgi:ABC-type Fe3+ transport system substrate-binding protein
MANPQFGTTGGDVASWLAHYGRARAEEILRSLKANDVRVVVSNSTAVREVALGKAAVCLTDTDDVYAGQRNGWPIAMHPLDQGGKGALTIPNTAAMIRGAPHAAQARTLMAFLLSQRVEEMLAASDSHNTSIRPALAERFAKYRVGKPLEIEYDKVADALPEAIRAAGEILR